MIEMAKSEIRWIVTHYFDQRPKASGEQAVTLDTETRKAIGALKAVIDSLNLIRDEAGMPPI